MLHADTKNIEPNCRSDRNIILFFLQSCGLRWHWYYRLGIWHLNTKFPGVWSTQNRSIYLIIPAKGVRSNKLTIFCEFDSISQKNNKMAMKLLFWASIEHNSNTSRYTFTTTTKQANIFSLGLTVGSQSAQCHEYPRFLGFLFRGGSKHVKWYRFEHSSHLHKHTFLSIISYHFAGGQGRCVNTL